MRRDPCCLRTAPAEPRETLVLALLIPADLRRLLGIGPGSRLSLKLEGKGVHMAVEPGRKTGTASEVIGFSGYRGPPIPIEAMDPAAFAREAPSLRTGAPPCALPWRFIASCAVLLSFDQQAP